MKLIKFENRIYKATERQFKEIEKHNSSELRVGYYGTDYTGHRSLMKYLDSIIDELTEVGELDLEINR